MGEKKKINKPKEDYEKPQMKKIYSIEDNRVHPYEDVAGATSGGGCCSCSII